jgi:hypothetical protein
MNVGTIEGRFKQDNGVPFRVLGGEAVLVDPRRREVHRFNETGTKIWEGLKHPRTVPDLIADLAALYPEDVAAIEAEVVPFVSSLIEFQLVVRVEDET